METRQKWAVRRQSIQKTGGFTFIELIVVITIIVVITALALPVLSKAVETSRRATCANNLRQCFLLNQEYADDNLGMWLIGDSEGVYQRNFELYSTDAQSPVIWGQLAQERLITAPQTFYCPSMTWTQFQFNNSANLWPKNGQVEWTQNQGTYCRTDYSTRAQIGNNVYTWIDPAAGSAYPFPAAGLPRMQDISATAIAGDLICTQNRIKAVHITGVNVLYSDGSHRWATAKSLAILPINDNFGAAWNATLQLAWGQLDLQY